MMGGIVANNASGMCCGVIENSYHTLESMVMVLPNGITINTADPKAGETFKSLAPQIANGIMALREEILSNAELCARIRAKYRLKNTTGYSLNAFIDYDTPVQILAHLMVGSEGTLGFIAESVLRTIPEYPSKYTALLLFDTVQAAASAVFPLRDSGARAIEFMDRPALRSVEKEPGLEMLRGLPETAAALLVEYQTSTTEEMAQAKQAAQSVLQTLTLLRPAQFTESAAEQAVLWKIRKGLYPSIGGMRKRGTSVLIEDVTFPLEKLADAVTDLQESFILNGYHEAIIFGHAKDGNLHFVLTPSFDSPETRQQYARFIDEVVELVVKKYDGALKAEHGTGRNMAPFVETEWGQEAYSIMARLKKLLDPDDLLNPGVIINDDPHAHLKDLKTWAQVEDEVDRCMECGFCEPRCPSRDLTQTPRRRIIIWREIARLRQTREDISLLEELEEAYQYDGIETCAADSFCAIACPLHIDTGAMIKHLRADSISPRGQEIALGVTRRFKLVENGLRLGVGLGHTAEKMITAKGVTWITRTAEKVARTALPKWSDVVPSANFARLPETQRETAQVVYFPACISRVMGTSPRKGEPNVIEVMVEVSGRAGIEPYLPKDSPGNCCGMPFSSKGFTPAFQETLHRTVERFWDWSQAGKLPIVIDSSSCAYTLITAGDKALPDDQEKLAKMTLLDPVEYAYRFLLPKLKFTPLEGAVVLHPNCSATKLGLADKMAAIARACAQTVVVPNALRCCGYAGDRGLLFPELTASASKPEADEVLSREYAGFYSSNITCEMGMRQATGKPYQSILYLIERATRNE
jgi:D-lactate dehydrogenase